MGKIKVENNFHRTSAWIIPKSNEDGIPVISAAVERRIRKRLCISQGCTCGGYGGIRGGDYVLDVEDFDHETSKPKTYRVLKRSELEYQWQVPWR